MYHLKKIEYINLQTKIKFFTVPKNINFGSGDGTCIVNVNYAVFCFVFERVDFFRYNDAFFKDPTFTFFS